MYCAVCLKFAVAVITVSFVKFHDAVNPAAVSYTHLREHVRRFHELFFTLSPEKSAIEHNVKRALLLADKSVYHLSLIHIWRESVREILIGRPRHQQDSRLVVRRVHFLNRGGYDPALILPLM